MKKNEW